jgi:hypothetical protein
LNPICLWFTVFLCHLMLQTDRCFSNSGLRILLDTARSCAIAAGCFQGITMLMCFMMKKI